jgi:hypothetical protein
MVAGVGIDGEFTEVNGKVRAGWGEVQMGMGRASHYLVIKHMMIS